MEQKITNQKINRRRFIQVAALAGVTLAGGNTLSAYAPWLDYEEQLGVIHRPMERNISMEQKMMEFIRYATMAASGHNTQPWQFVTGENEIHIKPDYSRDLPVVDAQHRELWISLGCALENLLLAAHSAGYVSTVTYPDQDETIHIRLEEGNVESSELFDAIPRRQNTRSLYDGQPVEGDALAQLKALPLEEGIMLHFVEQTADSEKLRQFVRHGNVSQFSDRSFMDELVSWLRFNKRDAMATKDGLFSICSGNPQVPRWFGRLFMTLSDAQQQAQADDEKLESSAGTVVIASEQDDLSSWVRCGQVYQRLTLKMTSLHIKSALMNQPIEVSHLRHDFAQAIGLGSLQPQLLLRFGYAGEMPYSLRRPLDEVVNSPMAV